MIQSLLLVLKEGSVICSVIDVQPYFLNDVPDWMVSLAPFICYISLEFFRINRNSQLLK